MKSLVTIIFSVLLGAVSAAAPGANDEMAVRAAIAQFNAAAHAGDEAKLNALLHDNLHYVHSDGRPETKAQCIAALVKEKPKFDWADGWKVIVTGNVAIANADVTATLDGGARVLKLNLMMTWVKGAKGWQLIGRHTGRKVAS
jgi:ketosteroid isomerase-like protein